MYQTKSVEIIKDGIAINKTVTYASKEDFKKAYDLLLMYTKGNPDLYPINNIVYSFLCKADDCVFCFIWLRRGKWQNNIEY